MISVLRTYELYLAVINHFNPKRNYDFFRYQGKTRVTQESLDNRKEKFFFENLATKAPTEEYAIGYLVANVMVGNTYIRHMKVDVYMNWLAYRDAMVYKFQLEMEKFLDAKITRRKNSDTPLLIELYYAEIVSLEFIILQDLALNGELSKKYNTNLKDNLLWDELKKKMEKYKPFLENLWYIDQNILVQLQNVLRKSLT